MFFKIMMEPLLFVRFYFSRACGRKCLTPEMDPVVFPVIGRLFVDWFVLFHVSYLASRRNQQQRGTSGSVCSG